MFGAGIAISSLVYLLVPSIAKMFDVWGLVSIRIVQGLAQGLAAPSLHALYAHWAPTNEKSKIISLTFCGIPFGTVLANFVSGIIAVKFGWQSIFYFAGTSGVVWFILWAVFVRSSPQNDPFISEKEKEYILCNIEANCSKEKYSITPWKEIFSSPPVWAIGISSCLFNWGFYTFVIQLPSYLKGVLY